MDAFGFNDGYFPHFLYNRTMLSCLIMVKFKDSSAIIGNANGSESQTLADTWKIENISVRGYKRDIGI